MMWSVLFGLLATLAAGGTAQRQPGRRITVKNLCATTIWPGMYTTDKSTKPQQPTGWEAKPGSYIQFTVPDNWTAARIWARTGCTTLPDGSFSCLTGNCGKGAVGAGVGGTILCELTNMVPATLAEFTLVPGAADHYDVSLVDGFNVPLVIIPSNPKCEAPACGQNINAYCPPLLRTSLDQTGQSLACLHPCNAGFGQELYGNRACCSGGYNDPDACAICGVDYYNLFKDLCRTSYAYAYDEKSNTALWTCPADNPANYADYEVVFCPNGTDYVGPKLEQVNQKYFQATATCANKVTAFTQTFSVGPSPSSTLTSGTLPVVATALPGLDGAAAYEIVPSGGGGGGSGTVVVAPASITNTKSGGPSAGASPAPSGSGSGGGYWSVYWAPNPAKTASGQSGGTSASVIVPSPSPTAALSPLPSLAAPSPSGPIIVAAPSLFAPGPSPQAPSGSPASGLVAAETGSQNHDHCKGGQYLTIINT